MKIMYGITIFKRRCARLWRRPQTPLWVVWIAAMVACVTEILLFAEYSKSVEPGIVPEIFTLIADAMILCMPYLWLRGRWRLTVLIPVWGVAVFAYVNMWYVRAFYDMMPLDMLTMTQNMDDRVVDGAIEQLYLSDIWLLLPPILFTVLALLLQRRCRIGRFSPDMRMMTLVVTIVVAWVGFKQRSAQYNEMRGGELPQREMDRQFYELTGTRAYLQSFHFWRLGLVGYLWFQAESIFCRSELTEAERAEIEAFIAEQRAAFMSGLGAGDIIAANRDKNLILIIVESLAAEAPELRHNGKPVAPTLASLMSDSTVIVYDRMVPQTKHGRSSDGQLMYNTGLLPLRQVAVALRYASADYPSLAKALHRPSSEVIGDPPTIYAHNRTNLSYGYDRFRASETGYWYQDDRIFEVANEEARLLASKGGPFFLTVVSLTMHDPYDTPLHNPTDITYTPGDLDPRGANYLDRVREFDSRLKVFLEQLKSDGLYDNSVIVIASDHEPRDRCLPTGLVSSDILFMVVNSGLPGYRSHNRIGQVDVYPTILHVMGVNDYGFVGLGTDLLANPGVNYAIDAFGRTFGEPDEVISKRLERAWNVSEKIIEGRYF